MQLLLFTLDSSRYAIASASVAEIVRAVAITPLPGAPGVVAGVIDVRGKLVPVFDLRRRFGLPTREVDPADHFIIARTQSRTAALHVDQVLDLVDIDEQSIADPREHVAGAPLVAGVAMAEDGLALISDVEMFLSRAEQDTLDAALAARE